MDSVSLQPFTQEQWRAHQDQAIEKVHQLASQYIFNCNFIRNILTTNTQIQPQISTMLNLN